MLSKHITDYRYDSAAMLLNPDEVFDGLRAEGGVLWSPKLRRWMVTSKAGAQAVLRNRDFLVHDVFSSFDHVSALTKVDLRDLVAICRWVPFLFDGQRHTALRQLFARLLADIKPDYLAAFKITSQSLLAQMARKGQGDLALDYTDCLHAGAMGQLLGLDQSDQLWLAQNSGSQGSIEFAASVTEMLDASQRATEVLALLERHGATDYGKAFLDKIGARLVSVGLSDTARDRIECLAALVLLGRDTISGTLSLGIGYLLDAHPQGLTPTDWKQLGGQRPADLVDEVIRLSSAVQITTRIATKDAVICGQSIAAGETVIVLLPAANHDPSVFDCPHQVNNTHQGHIAYGASRHLCLAMPLANAAVAQALEDLSGYTLRALQGRQVDTGRNTRKFKTFPVQIKA